MHVSVRVMGLTVLLQCHVDGEEERKQAQRDEGRFLQLTLALALEQQMEPDKNSLHAHLTGLSIMPYVGDSNLPTSQPRPLLPWPALAPCDVLLKFGTRRESSASGSRLRTSGHLGSSDITLSLSPQVVTLLKQVIQQVTVTLGGTSGSTISTRRYMLVHSECEDHITGASNGFSADQGMDGMNTGVAFWRPLPVAGYCSLGDLVTCGCSIKAPPQPTWSAVMVRDSGALVLPPKAYKKVWSFEGDVNVWLPVPTKGFVAMGCIAHVGRDPPPLHISRCVRKELVVPITAESVIQTTSGAFLFRLANCASTFLARAPEPTAYGAAPAPCSPPFNLRLPLGLQTDAAAAAAAAKSSSRSAAQSDALQIEEEEEPGCFSAASSFRSLEGGTPLASTRTRMFGKLMSRRGHRHANKPLVNLIQLQATDEDKIWSSIDAKGFTISGITERTIGTSKVTVWRPSHLPPGYASFGDVAVAGVKPPQCLYAVKADAEALAPPQDFELVWMDGGSMCAANTSFWRTVPPRGFVALGDVVSRGHHKPPLDLVLCVRADLAEPANADKASVWNSSGASSGSGQSDASVWSVTHPLPDVDNALSLRTFKADASLKLSSKVEVHRLPDCAVLKGRELMISPPSLLPLPAREAPESNGPATLAMCTVVNFVRVWWSKRTGSMHATFWRPVPPPGFFSLGDCAQKRLVAPVTALAVSQPANSKLLAPPQRFELVWRDSGSRGRTVSMWRAVPPPGFVALGDLVCAGHERPPFDAIRCVRQDLTNQVQMPPTQIWTEVGASSKLGSDPVSVWKIDERTCTFKVQAGYQPPDQTTLLQLRRHGVVEDARAAPVAITAKLGDLSLRMHDDASSTKAPVLGLSLQGLEGKVAGTDKAMRLTVSDLEPALQSFNLSHGVWEPVIEPFKLLLEVDMNKADNLGMSPPGTHVKVKGDGGLRLVHTLDFVKGIHVANSGRVNALKGLSPGSQESVDVKNGLGQTIYLQQDSERALLRAAPRVSPVQQDGLFTLRHTQLESVPPLTNSTPTFRQTRLVSVVISHAANLALPASTLPRELAVRLSLNEVTKLNSSKSTDSMGSNKNDSNKTLLSMRTVCSQNAELTKEEETHADQKVETWRATWREQFFMEMPYGEELALAVVLVDLGPTGQSIGVPVASGMYQGLEVMSEVSLPIPLSMSTPSGTDPPPGGTLHVCVAPVISPDADGMSIRTQMTPRVADNGRNQRLGECHGPVHTPMSIHPTGPWMHLGAHLKTHGLPGTRTPVVLEPEGGGQGTALVLETTSHSEVLLRTPVQVHNAASFAIQLLVRPVESEAESSKTAGRGNVKSFSLKRLTGSKSAVSGSPTRGDSGNGQAVDECFENQRYLPLRDFGYNMLPGERGPFSDARGVVSYSSLPRERAPEGWRWEGDWELDLSGDGDPVQGWSYAADFNRLSFPWPPGRGRASAFDFVRSRRWIRRRSRSGSSRRTSTSGETQRLWAVKEGEAQPLPLALCKSTDPETTLELVVRPATESLAAGGTGGGEAGALAGGGRYQWSVSSARDAPRKNILPSSLVKTVVPLSCSQDAQLVGTGAEPHGDSASGAGGERQVACHLVASVAGEIMEQASGDAVVDWSVTVSAPLQITNALPFEARFVIYEKPSSTGKLVERERGRHLSGEVAHIYSVDLQRPVYITWEIEGWTQKKGPVLLCFGSDQNGHTTESVARLPRELSLVHPMHKSLHVRLDRSMELPFSAPLTVRMHVPLWLDNTTPFSLTYFLKPLKKKESAETPSEDEEGNSHAAKVQHTSPSKNASAPSNVQEREVRGGENIMLDAEFGTSSLCLMVGASGFSTELPIDPDCIPTVVHAQQPGGSVLSVVITPKQGPESMPFMLVVEPLVRVYNWTGGGLQVCQPAEAEATQEDLRKGTVTLPEDGSATPWVWVNPLAAAKAKGDAKGDAALRMSLKTEASRWSPCLSLPTTLCSEHSYIMLPVDPHSGTKPAPVLHVFKRLVRGCQMLEIIIEHAKPSHIPYHVVNRTKAALAVRQYAPELTEEANPWTPLPAMGAVPFAWGGNPGEDVEVVRVGAPAGKAAPTRFTLEEPADADTAMGAEISAAAASAHAPPSRANYTQKLPLPADFGGDALGCVGVDAGDPDGMRVKVLSIGLDAEAAAASALAEAVKPKSELVVDVGLEHIEVSAMDPANLNELVLLSVNGLTVKFGASLGSGADSLLAVSVQQCQLDDLSLFSPYPTMLAHDPTKQPFLDLLYTQVESMDASIKIHPFIGVRMDGGSLQIKITESTLWRLVRAGQAWGAALASQAPPEVVVNVDPTLIIQVMMLPRVHTLLWFNMEPGSSEAMGLGQRMTLPNLDRMRLDISPIDIRDDKLSQSLLVETVKQKLVKQVIAQLYLVAIGAMFGMLDNASDALGSAGRYIANINKDQQPDQQAPQERYSGSQGGLHTSLLDGTMALGKGVVGGVTGVVLNPIKGAQQEGMTGFVKGGLRGVFGLGTSTVGGAFEFASKGIQGVSTTIKQVGQTLTGDFVVSRRRPPRAVLPDGVLRVYDEQAALGQHVLRYAVQDRLLGGIPHPLTRANYIHHWLLPEKSSGISGGMGSTYTPILIFSAQGVVMVRNSGTVEDLHKEPCTIKWMVDWDNVRSIRFQPDNKSRSTGSSAIHVGTVMLRKAVKVPVLLGTVDYSTEMNFKCHIVEAGEIRMMFDKLKNGTLAGI